MKIREIGKKIGDIDIKAPSGSTQKKALVLISILYRLAYWGLILFGIFGVVVANDSKKPIGLIFIVATIVIDLIIKYVNHAYKKRTADIV